MTVYITKPKSRHRRMNVCIMTADTAAELITMAAVVGAEEDQFCASHKTHYRLRNHQARIAVEQGAVFPTTEHVVSEVLRYRDMRRSLRKRRENSRAAENTESDCTPNHLPRHQAEAGRHSVSGPSALKRANQ